MGTPDDTDLSLHEIFLNETADDDGNARCLYAAHGQEYLFCPAYGWMRWTGTHWDREGAESALELAIFALLKQRRHLAVDQEKDAVIKATSGSTRRNRDCKMAFKPRVEVQVNVFDNNPDLLCVQNGVLNLRTSELVPHDSEQRFTYCLPVPYHATACDDLWRQTLAQNVGTDPEVLAYLQQAVGYSFTGHTNEECFWYAVGPTRSGKGLFGETLLALLPYPLGLQADFSTFTVDRTGDKQNFDLAPLKPARLVIASESRRQDVLNDAKIKNVTGGEAIRCAFKYGDHFTYKPQFKVWMLSNHTPKGDVDDDALWNRIKVIEFPNGHDGAEDKTLKARLRSSEQLQGVLRWVVEGAKAWYENKSGLDAPWAIRQTTQRQRDELDHLQQWLNECVDIKEGNFVSNSTLYLSYGRWCKDNGQEAYEAAQFGRGMSKKGFERASKRTDENAGNMTRGYAGVILKAS